MTARDLTVLAVCAVLAPAIRASLSMVTAESDPASVVRAIDRNAAQVLALRGEG